MSTGYYRRCHHTKGNSGIKPHQKCTQICGRELSCGHKCKYDCHDMKDPGHFLHPCLQRCQKKCWKKGHPCEVAHPCYQDCPPCQVPVYKIMYCNHRAEALCYEAEAEIVCTKPCERMSACGHICRKSCGEECGLCEQTVVKFYDFCGHTVEVPCHSSLVEQHCVELVPTKKQPKCGHVRLVPCFKMWDIDLDNNDVYICRIECDNHDLAGNDCGHKCSGNCTDCFQGRFHVRCELPCLKKRPYCPHWCMDTCDKECAPCDQKCEAFCDHGRCKKLCSAPCKPCKKMCLAGCEHAQCSKLCCEPCDIKPCTYDCKKVLNCGHLCIGFCGDPCPPLCRVCDESKLEEGSMLEEEINDGDRFIYIKTCGHTVKSESMTTWMNTLNSEHLIQIATCPVCRNPIYNLKRYSSVMVANSEQMRAIKIREGGDPLENGLEISRLLLQTIRIGPFEELNFPSFQEYLVKLLLKSTDYMPRNGIMFLRSLIHILETAEKTMEEFRSVLKVVMFENLKKIYSNVFDILEARPIPLSAREIESLNREIVRINCAGNLLMRLKNRKNVSLLLYSTGLAVNTTASIFNMAYALIFNCRYFYREDETDFLEMLQDIDRRLHFVVGIDEKEKQEILRAVGPCSGRWCKCPNGHVYLITECGGAMQVSTCNECGELIGGESHVLLEQNYLAPEMDASFPL